MKKVDYIIVGQGIAGSLLSWFLHCAGKTVLVIDKTIPGSATRVAAGIINPVTGRKFVKSWLADTLLSFSEKSYRHLEVELNRAFYFPVNIIHYFNNEQQVKIWQNRIRTSGYNKYLSSGGKLNLPGQLHDNFGAGEIKGSAWLDTSKFLGAYRNWLINREALAEEFFDFDQIQFHSGFIQWRDVRAGKMIFCRGHLDSENPFFDNLPLNATKGELLTIKVDTEFPDYIFKRGIFILPNRHNLFEVGATYSWTDKTPDPTDAGRIELVQKLDKLLVADYEIIKQKAGFRPTVKDRRPLIGISGKDNRIGIFNGLGTKGISLAPYFASHFKDHLISAIPLNPEIDISRFI